MQTLRLDTIYLDFLRSRSWDKNLSASLFVASDTGNTGRGMRKRDKGKKAASKGTDVQQVTGCGPLEGSFTGKLWEAMEGLRLSSLRGWESWDACGVNHQSVNPALKSPFHRAVASCPGEQSRLQWLEKALYAPVCRCWQWEGRHWSSEGPWSLRRVGQEWQHGLHQLSLLPLRHPPLPFSYLSSCTDSASYPFPKCSLLFKSQLPITSFKSPSLVPWITTVSGWSPCVQGHPRRSLLERSQSF